jgi:hypothetical protein
MFNAKLITLDKQQSERASEFIEVASPQDELKNFNTASGKAALSGLLSG